MLTSAGLFLRNFLDRGACSKGASVKYQKPPLSIDEQVNLLRARGLQGEETEMAEKLRDVSYYRLSGYMFPFRILGSLPGATSDQFRPGTTFELVWDHYVFDRELRLLVLDAIERVEVSVRTRLSYEFAHAHGAFAIWDDPKSLLLSVSDRVELLINLRAEVARNKKEAFLAHFYRKYGDEHPDPPIWMLTEVLSLGSIVRLLDGVARPVRDRISAPFGVPDEVLISWLRMLNFVRNVCAHHSRLWNRTLSYRVLLPKERKHPEWHRPVAIPNDKFFAVATILRSLLRVVSPATEWGSRLRSLLASHPRVRLSALGFPADWERSPLWREP